MVFVQRLDRFETSRLDRFEAVRLDRFEAVRLDRFETASLVVISVRVSNRLGRRESHSPAVSERDVDLFELSPPGLVPCRGPILRCSERSSSAADPLQPPASPPGGR